MKGFERYLVFLIVTVCVLVTGLQTIAKDFESETSFEQSVSINVDDESFEPSEEPVPVPVPIPVPTDEPVPTQGPVPTEKPTPIKEPIEIDGVTYTVITDQVVETKTLGYEDVEINLSVTEKQLENIQAAINRQKEDFSFDQNVKNTDDYIIQYEWKVETENTDSSGTLSFVPNETVLKYDKESLKHMKEIRVTLLPSVYLYQKDVDGFITAGSSISTTIESETVNIGFSNKDFYTVHPEKLKIYAKLGNEIYIIDDKMHQKAEYYFLVPDAERNDGATLNYWQTQVKEEHYNQLMYAAMPRDGENPMRQGPDLQPNSFVKIHSNKYDLKQIELTPIWNEPEEKPVEPYTPSIYRVEFKDTGDTNIPNQEVVSGKCVDKPMDPTKKGYEFNGWMIEKDVLSKLHEIYSPRSNDDLVKFDFDTKISRDITLVASWKESKKPTVVPSEKEEPSNAIPVDKDAQGNDVPETGDRFPMESMGYLLVSLLLVWTSKAMILKLKMKD